MRRQGRRVIDYQTFLGYDTMRLAAKAADIYDDWDDYQRFHRQRQHRRLYGTHSAIVPMPEYQVLALAA